MASESSASPPHPDPQVRDFVLTNEEKTAIGSGSTQRKTNLALVPPSRTRPDGQVADRKPLRSAFPLYPANIWSPGENPSVRSAGLPPKPSWETLKSPARTGNVSFTTSNSTFSFNSTAGLGVSTSGRGDVRRNHGHRLDFKAPGSAVRYTQTQDYHNSADTGGVFVKTDPLPQQPFALMDKRIVASSSKGSNSSNGVVYDFGNPIASAGHTAAGDSLQNHDGENAGSSRVLMQSGTHGEDEDATLNETKGDVWTERQNTRCIRRALKDPSAEWEEAYTGALTVLGAVNPEHFQMPANSRVINIKTEFVDNLITSIRLGKYSVMQKVSERIMKVWEDRSDPAEKVLFLFSVNGSKKFSGLAEISGPWNPKSFIDGWNENAESHGCIGSFPVTWVYVKDIPYYQFTHIKQPGNEHPVGNMWNGMNFPPATGRAVVQHYVETPATTSILGYPKSNAESHQRHDARGIGQRRSTFGNRGQRGGGRGGFRGGHNDASSWRQQLSQQSDNEAIVESQDDDSTPTPSGRGCLSNRVQAPPTCDLSAPENSTIWPADLSSASSEAKGKVISRPAGPASVTSYCSGPSATQGSSQSEMVQSPHQNMLLRLDTRASNESLHNGRRSGPTSTVSSRSSGAASASYSGLRDSFSDTANNHPGLQHSTSMGILSSQSGYPLHVNSRLLPSVSMNSLPVHPKHARGHGHQASQAFGYAEQQTSQQHLEKTLPLRQDMMHGGQLQRIRETPIYRPIPHTANVHGVAGLARVDHRAALGPLATRHQLMASYHALQAENCNLQDKLQAIGTSSMDRPYINAQLLRNTTEIRAVEAEMSMDSPGAMDDSSPERRHGSFQYGDTNSSSSGSGPNISPVRAEDGHSLYSASLLGSPYSYAQGGYIHGPHHGGYGGHSGNGGHGGHGSRSSWDLRVGDVDRLIATPKNDDNTSAPSASSRQASSAFHGCIGDRALGNLNFSFHAPNSANRQNKPRGGVRIDT